jgi:HK97 family phage portal protein
VKLPAVVGTAARLPGRAYRAAVRGVARYAIRRKYLTSIGTSLAGWWPLVRESFAGAWQQNITIDMNRVSTNWAVFACVTLIAGDIAKMPARVLRQASNGIWQATLFRPVLRRPNHFQTWADFVSSWLFSLLLRGNTYVLLVRDEARRVTAMYVLDPSRVMPLVSDSGEVFYDLNADNLAGLTRQVAVPASEIMHDRINTLWHPLCGVSPIFACGMAAMQGIAMQENSALFFQNMSQPGGVMTAPGPISDETAERLKASFAENFTGDNLGNLLVLGDGLKYEAMTISAKDSQLIEQLKFTGEMICAVYHVPPYKLGLGTMPAADNLGALNQQYYDQCLHPLVNGIEGRLDIGLEVAEPFEMVVFDTSELLRMDPAARFEAHGKAIGAAIMAPNEARKVENLEPKPGGDTPYLQEQNFSLAALAVRDGREIADPKADPEKLQAIVVSVAEGKIPLESARAMIAATFPALTSAQVDAIVEPLEGFQAEPDEPPPAPPADDAGVDEDDARAFVFSLLRQAA